MALNKTEGKISRIFRVKYKGLELEFELFTIDYIYSELMKQKNSFESLHRIMLPDRNVGRCIRENCMDGNQNKYYFFRISNFLNMKGRNMDL